MFIAASALLMVAPPARVAALQTRGVVLTASFFASPKQAVAPPVQADRPALHVGVLIRPVAALTPCSGAPMLHVCAPALHAAAPKPRVCTVMIVCHALRRRFPVYQTSALQVVKQVVHTREQTQPASYQKASHVFLTAHSA